MSKYPTRAQFAAAEANGETIELPYTEDNIAAALAPRDYLRFRLNANLRNRRLLPAAEGWRINRETQPERDEMIRLGLVP